MNILVVGPDTALAEFAKRFEGLGTVDYTTGHHFDRSALRQYDAVFDFLVAEDPDAAKVYKDCENLVLFYNAPYVQLLAEIQRIGLKLPVAGFNGMPGMVARPLMEISLPQKAHEAAISRVLTFLKANYTLVEDRVGMVTPRILAMIINEAYFTLQEGTASRDDIDISMKLGTNYPYGPFEWARMLGLDQVARLIEAVWNDTRDERYKLCPLLRTETLQARLMQA